MYEDDLPGGSDLSFSEEGNALMQPTPYWIIRTCLAPALLAAALTGILTSPAAAQEDWWPREWFPTDDNWFADGNWRTEDPNNPLGSPWLIAPTAESPVYINSSTVSPVIRDSDTNGTAVSDTLFIGWARSESSFSGTLTIEQGGHLHTSGNAALGSTGGSAADPGAIPRSGTVVVQNNSLWELFGDIVLGDPLFEGGHGSLTVKTGSTLATHNILSGLAPSTANLTVDGGTLRALSSETDFITVEMNVGFLGATIDTNGHDLGMSHTISGNGSLTKQGAGMLRLSGGNTFGNAGTGLTVQAGTLRADAANAIPNNVDLNVNGGVLNLNNFDVNGGALAGAGGELAVGTATLSLNHHADRTFAGIITGGGSDSAIVKGSDGTLTLTGDNPYTGDVEVHGGTLKLDGGALEHIDTLRLGFNGSPVALTIENGGILDHPSVAGNAAFGNVTIADPDSRWTLTSGNLLNVLGTMTVADDGVFEIQHADAQLAFMGDVNIGDGGGAGLLKVKTVSALSTGSTLNINHDGTDHHFTDDGSASGVPIVIINNTSVAHLGPGTTTLHGASTYTGTTTVEAGTLRAGAAGALPDDTAYTIHGGTLDLNGHMLTASALAGTGGSVDLGNATLTVDQADDTSFAGAVAGAGGLTKQGDGTLTLAGTNTHTGPTTIDNGTLRVEGSLTESTITVNADGTLAGSGSVGDVIVSGGTLGPGSSPGTLHTGSLTFGDSSLLVFELDGLSEISDLIAVDGDLTLDGILNVINLGGLEQGNYTLIDYTGNLIDNGLTLGSLPEEFGYVLDTTSTPGSVELHVIPEPASAVLLALGGLVLCVRSRR